LVDTRPPLNYVLGAELPPLIWLGETELRTPLIPPRTLCNGHPYRGNKPRRGGWWLSPWRPESRSCAWLDWIRENEFETRKSSVARSVRLQSDARVLRIASKDDLEALCGRFELPAVPSLHPEDEHFWPVRLNFERIRREYAAIYLTEAGQRETHPHWIYPNLFGWDCETVLVLDPCAIDWISPPVAIVDPMRPAQLDRLLLPPVHVPTSWPASKRDA